MTTTLKYISYDDIVQSPCSHIRNILNIIEAAFLAYSQGQVLLPEKICQIFDLESQNRINCMPATLLGDQICGVKWVSIFPKNPSLHNIANVAGLIILSELEKGLPIAIMDGTYCTSARTAGVGAVAAKYLAKPSSQSICLIGAGEQAKMHFIAMKEVFPNLKQCHIVSRQAASEAKLKEDLERLYPDISCTTFDTNLSNAPKNCDIIVTATSTQAPLLQASSIKNGAFYCHVGGWEDEYAVALKADKIVCDDWENVKHRTQTISKMYQEGILRDDMIHPNLYEIIARKAPGRENNDEFIYFNSVGLAFLDIAISHCFYQQLNSENIGLHLPR